MDVPLPVADQDALVLKSWRSHQLMASLQSRTATGRTIKFSWHSDTKPDVGESDDAKLLPLWVEQLRAGATHTTRRLTGEVFEDAIYTGL